MLRKLLIGLAILVVLLVIGDFVAKAYATSQLRDRAESHVRGATSASASISSFPFTARGLRLPLQVRIPRAPLFPCDATSAVVKEGAVDLSCTVHQVPTELAGVSVKA